MTERVRYSYTSIDGTVVTKRFYVNGTDKPTADSSLDVAALPHETILKLAAYGINAAGNAQIHQGIVADATEALKLWNAFVSDLHADKWTPGRIEATPPSELALAIERFEQRNPATSQHTLEEIMEQLEKLSPVEKRQLHSDPELVPHIRDIRIEKARAKAKTAKGTAADKPSLLKGLFRATPEAQAAAE